MSFRQAVNILLVDDQPAKLLSYETILAELGENLIRANSGREALEQLLKHDIAVVLVDVCMPELDGFELAAMIKQHPRYQKTAIILVSGVLVDDRDRLKGYDAGAMDYVAVPIVPEILRAKVAVFADLFRKTVALQKLNEELERRVLERTAEIHAASERLRHSEERLRLVLTASHIQGWTWDIGKDEITRVSAASEREDPVGPLQAFLASLHADDRERVSAALSRAVSGAEDYAAEFRTLADGQEHWWLGRGTVRRDEAGQALSMAGINIDITERRRAEEERARLLEEAQEARRQAESANRIKDEFLATLSHELRTPLNAIVGWTHMLRRGRLDERTQQKALETIDRNARLQAQLIADLLDVSRIITGNLRLQLEPVHLPALLQATLDTVRPAAEAKGIRLEAHLGYEGATLSGDPARLQQIVWNLLSNAIRFAPKGGQVEIRLETLGSYVELVVRDDGPGIEPEFLPHIFERFRQADSSSTRRHQGLGLGLAIVRHLTEMHGGSVRAANRDDRTGAVLTIQLPRRVPPLHLASLDEPDPDPAGRESSWLEGTPSLSGVRVLVVDDDDDAREIVAALLGSCGAQIAAAATVSEALTLFERQRPHVVVADIEMPDQDGYALLRALRARPAEQGGSTPVIALTAYASAQDRQKILGAGFDLHLVKPAEPAELVTGVSRVVTREAVGGS